MNATLPWEWPVACAIDATVRAPRMPSARARTRIPRIARARADLGDLRCADNLRCAPPDGPLVDVPFHNELRLFIGEGPLFGDIDSGPLGSRTYSSTGAEIRHSGRFRRGFPHMPVQVAPDRAGSATCATSAPYSTYSQSVPRHSPVTDATGCDHRGRHEKRPPGCRAA